MKKIYMLLLSAIVAGSAFAQGSASGSKLKYGIKAGVNFASISVSEGDAPKSITSFHIGGLVDYALTEKITLQPGLMLNGMGSKYEQGSFKSTTNLMYLQIPINFLYKVGAIYFGAGPYAAFALSGKIKETDSDDSSNNFEEKIKFGSGDNDDLKGTDFGLNVLAGYQLTNGVNLGLGYGLGLSNLSNSSSGTAKNKVFSVSVGYAF